MQCSKCLPLHLCHWKSCAWKSERRQDIMARKRERRETCGRKVESSFFVQSKLSACCFGNVMSAQPLAIPLRLPRTEHRGGCACVALYEIFYTSCEELTFWGRLNNLAVPTVHKFHLIKCFASTFHILAFFPLPLSLLSVCYKVWMNTVSVCTKDWTLSKCTEWMSSFHKITINISLFLLPGSLFVAWQHKFYGSQWIDSGSCEHISFFIGNENRNLDIWDQRLLYSVCIDFHFYFNGVV